MKATVMYGAGDVRVENVSDPRILQPTDAIVRVTHACICGSDLWPYQQMEPTPTGRRMGHEFIGIVEDTGSDVRTVKRVRALTNGLGAHSVLECVGHGQSTETALGIVRAGGAVGRVGVPQQETLPASIPTFFGNVTIAGGATRRW
jgi:threonine dehydrogenase-like Zn-dependent dehydrogenase